MKPGKLIEVAVIGVVGFMAYEWWTHRPHVGPWALAPGRSYRATVRMAYRRDALGAPAGALAELSALGIASGFSVSGVAPASGQDPYLWTATLVPSPMSANGGAIQDTGTVKVISVT